MRLGWLAVVEAIAYEAASDVRVVLVAVKCHSSNDRVAGTAGRRSCFDNGTVNSCPDANATRKCGIILVDPDPARTENCKSWQAERRAGRFNASMFKALAFSTQAMINPAPADKSSQDGRWFLWILVETRGWFTRFRSHAGGRTRADNRFNPQVGGVTVSENKIVAAFESLNNPSDFATELKRRQRSASHRSGPRRQPGRRVFKNSILNQNEFPVSRVFLKTIRIRQAHRRMTSTQRLAVAISGTN